MLENVSCSFGSVKLFADPSICAIAVPVPVRSRRRRSVQGPGRAREEHKEPAALLPRRPVRPSPRGPARPQLRHQIPAPPLPRLQERPPRRRGAEAGPRKKSLLAVGQIRHHLHAGAGVAGRQAGGGGGSAAGEGVEGLEADAEQDRHNEPGVLGGAALRCVRVAVGGDGGKA